ncbi:winged helix-turn-helix domain-containing protein [Pseudoalteromonas sp. SWYJZ12]|uniref:winged helix-turn-helix domain-containing protein n=1 Tax=Pseudoalteromonas sp. SWYJZ12 TaxID=2792067 RepID=UPI00280B2858|nr:winged helix-turn-helix domain-containing protein [Pseudoalteromonas sp. SWYJZ12]
MGRFVIGEFAIDVSRCKISSADTEQVVEPKVMDVLQYMYSHRGTVVSQEQIFSAVWPNATFSPSYVQRCIALLRKALGEDSKNPRYIITHPKRGYSLEVDVAQLNRPKCIYLSVLVILMVTLSGIASWLYPDTPQVKTRFTKLMPISSSEENESSTSLSHNGEYIAFVRGDKSKQAIWLKNLRSGKEVKLTQKQSTYHSLGWSSDDSEIAFVNQDDTQTLGYFTLDKLTLQPANYRTIYTFKDFKVTSQQLEWANNNNIYFIEKRQSDNHTQLSTIDLTTQVKRVVKEAAGQDWMMLHALSPSQQYIALTSESGQNQYRIDLFDIETSSTKTLATVEDGVQGLSWHPNAQQLLISNKHQLQLLNLQGHLTKLAFNNYHIIRDAHFSLSGNDILMELVKVDVDIIRSTRQEPTQFETLVDTSSVDFLPVYSPDSSKFVFESHRFGTKQLFLYENGTQTLIFSNPNNEELFGIVWSKDGEEVITASKNTLFRINLEEESFQSIPHSYHSFYLREMYHHEAAILVSYRAADGVTFHPAKFDLETLELTPYTGSGKRLECYAMDIDERDLVYFSNDKQVFRLNEKNELEIIWESPTKEIIGLAVHETVMTVTLADKDGYEMNEIDFNTGRSKAIFKGKDDGEMLINASHDFQQFLYLTEPKRIRTLVRLN